MFNFSVKINLRINWRAKIDKMDAFIFLLLLSIQQLFPVKAEETQIGELIDSRSRSKKTLYYNCFEGQEGDGSELSVCVGKRCFRMIHHESNAIRLFCKNFTEPDDPAPGKCTTIITGQMPGQTEMLCACEGNYCNGAVAGNSYSIVLLLTCLIAVMLCSSIVGTILFRRQ